MAQEFRGLWVDAFGPGFSDKTEITKLVDDCRKHNFNAILVQMRRRGDAYYIPHKPNTDIRTQFLPENFDALAEIIKQCHGKTPKIEVHCWVTANLIWSSNGPPPQAEHIFNQHPEYLTKDNIGQTYIGKGCYLDPGNPDAIQTLHNMAMDIVKHYDIDGFHWDYLRYPGQNSGYNEIAIKRYNAEFNLSGLPSPKDKQFSEWRRRQVTDFLRWTDADLLELKPKLVISVSVFSNLIDSYGYRFQDWPAWNKEGIVDLCIPMDFTADNKGVFEPRLKDAFKNQGIRRIYVGQAAYLNTKENTAEQLQEIRNARFSGFVLYDYRHSNTGKLRMAETFSYLVQKLQTNWVKTPELPWKTMPVNGIIKGTVLWDDPRAPVYNAEIILDNFTNRIQMTEPHGNYAFFEVPVGIHKITITSKNGPVETKKLDVRAGKITAQNFLLKRQ